MKVIKQPPSNLYCKNVHADGRRRLAWVALPDSRRVEAAFVNEGAVFDEVCEDGAHRALIARGLDCQREGMEGELFGLVTLLHT